MRALGQGPGDSVPSTNPHALSSRSVSGVDADPDLVHMEAQDVRGGKPGGLRAPGVPLSLYPSSGPGLVHPRAVSWLSRAAM